jgi:hypothetical protein
MSRVGMLPRGDYLAFSWRDLRKYYVDFDSSEGSVRGSEILQKAPISSKLDALPKRGRLGNNRGDGCIDYEEMREDWRS